MESATTSPATLRRQATAQRLTAVSRQFTAERGLNGFTVEEVCSEVGVSRRTFFNYFPTKEDAILGVDETDEFVRFTEQFLARPSRGWSVVVDDLIELAGEHMRNVALGVDEHLQLMRVLDREPRILARFIGLGRERNLAIAQLIATRESVAPDDPRVRAAVDIVTTVMRSTGECISDPRVADDFGAALLDTLAAIRAVLNS
jgi:AcrR family transcriptional regulator